MNSDNIGVSLDTISAVKVINEGLEEVDDVEEVDNKASLKIGVTWN